MASELVGISTTCDLLNIGGAIKIEYVPIEWVDRAMYSEIPDANYNMPEVPLLSGKTWLSCFVLVGKRAWEAKSNSTALGNYYDCALSAMIPRLTPELSRELMRTHQHRFILRVKDANDMTWIFGTLQMPYSFDFSYNSAQGNTQIKFTGKSMRMTAAYYFTPLPPINIPIPTYDIDYLNSSRFTVEDTLNDVSGTTVAFTPTLSTLKAYFVTVNGLVYFPTLSGATFTLPISVEVGDEVKLWALTLGAGITNADLINTHFIESEIKTIVADTNTVTFTTALNSIKAFFITVNDRVTFPSLSGSTFTFGETLMTDDVVKLVSLNVTAANYLLNQYFDVVDTVTGIAGNTVLFTPALTGLKSYFVIKNGILANCTLNVSTNYFTFTDTFEASDIIQLIALRN